MNRLQQKSRHERVRHGQFYTPAALCDLMLALCWHSNLQQPEGRLLDPGCGEGAFLVRALDRLTRLEGLSHADALGRLRGIELEPAAAQAAIANLQDVPEGATVPAPQCLPQIVTGDFLSPAADQLGRFDVIVGNPPYVRQEHWQIQPGDKEPGKKKDALQRLASALSEEYPTDSLPRDLLNRTGDLYLWFFLQASVLLKPGGRLAFVTSNSWMNADFGKAFQQFLTRHFQIDYLVESACERWFADAAINPVILVLTKKPSLQTHSSEPAERAEPVHPEEPARLFRLQTPLHAWMPDPAQPDYWPALLQQVETRLQLREEHPPLASLSALPPEARLLTQPSLADTRNWGFALRISPDFAALMEQSRCWHRLDAWGQVRYPLKTGINAFFYLSRAQAAEWEIESEFLVPVVKSLRDIRTLTVSAADCQRLLFACPASIEELEAQGKTGTLAYIRWGETQVAAPRQKRAHPVPWPNVASVRHRRPWYAIKPLLPPHLLASRFLDQRFLFPLCAGALVEDQTFYGITLHSETAKSRTEGGQASDHRALASGREDQLDSTQNAYPNPAHFLAALLNSTLSWKLLEFQARTNLGEGVLQYARGDMAAFPVPHPDLYSPRERTQIETAFAALQHQAVQPVAESIHTSEREALDLAVLTPLLRAAGITQDPRSFRAHLAERLLARMQERRLMARTGRPGHNGLLGSPSKSP